MATRAPREAPTGGGLAVSPRRVRPPAAAGAVAVAALCAAGCRSRSISVAELDAIARSAGVETIVFEPTYSIYSPYSAGGTDSYAMLVGVYLQAMASLLGVEEPSRVIVWLEPDPGMGPSLEIEGDVYSLRPADAPPPAFLEATTFVREDGTVIKGSFGASLYLTSIRHELAHCMGYQAGFGPESPSWLLEGLAETLAGMELRDGTLVLGEPPEVLCGLAAVPRAERGLADLLDWNGPSRPPTPRDRLRYGLAHAYVRFLLEGAPADAVLPTLRAAAAAPRTEHLAREPAWWAWTEALAAAEATAEAADP